LAPSGSSSYLRTIKYFACRRRTSGSAEHSGQAHAGFAGRKAGSGDPAEDCRVHISGRPRPGQAGIDAGPRNPGEQTAGGRQIEQQRQNVAAPPFHRRR
jgi:hypothetical protein